MKAIDKVNLTRYRFGFTATSSPSLGVIMGRDAWLLMVAAISAAAIFFFLRPTVIPADQRPAFPPPAPRVCFLFLFRICLELAYCYK